ncbi:Outer membrane lipid asymmetry maintenance protein MlaD [Rhodovastum atsumiense]|uniref:Outer membrane lipid asymmetry maintenance protein MlaD n=1 Tax=Rhodovastum atsumiense TaxID=504468 RepID=A0A5M6J3S3_9PROT|nr:outer membrane lipid asymmetry maintenance protein MlaD [Rhodovastum atsumiense]KAA5614258.1 outer membrane lipid asymmetry maintenance protein MlaD [Rhodovastum atsumiense]CAH2604710.1 Outer membrane lipid asymmetry maintenance protein MlaD [Rhodovastum atsumiense]
MAQRSLTETLAGAVVLVVALGFLGYAVANTGRTPVAGYTLQARFDRIDGLNIGSDVRVAGVKVGSVTAARIDPQTYQAMVSFTVQDGVKLPTDSSAEVTSDGLLGGKYLSLVPGGEEKMLPPGGAVQITQSSVSLEQLLGKFIFSVSNLSSQGGQGKGGGPGGEK